MSDSGGGEVFVPLPPSGEMGVSPRLWLPWLKSSSLLPPPPYSMGGINPCSGYRLGHTLLGQGLCLPKSGYTLPPPYSESQGAYYFLGSSQDNSAIILATSGLRPLPVSFSSACCHWCVLSWPLGNLSLSLILLVHLSLMNTGPAVPTLCSILLSLLVSTA